MNLLLWLLPILAVAFVNGQSEQSIPGAQPVGRVFKAKEAHIKKLGGGKGGVTGKNAKGQDYNIDAARNEANAHALGNSKNWKSDYKKGSGITSTNARGNNAKIIKTGTSGGNYKTDRNTGTLDSNKQGNDRVLNLQNNGGRQKMQDTLVGGAAKLDVIKAQGTRGNEWNVDQTKTDRGGSVGTINRATAKKTMNYNVVNNGDGTEEATLEDPSKASFFSKSKKYTCTGQKVGVTVCKDELGRKVGEVRTAVNGDTVVTNSLGATVTSVRAQKDPQTGAPTAVVSGGLLKAKSTSQQDGNCPGFTNDKVKIRKPLHFKYAHSEDPGRQGATFDWPACFDVTGTIDLAPNIEAKNLAIKFTPMILPAGRMTCSDPATSVCGGKSGDCYYCNLCDPAVRGKISLLNNQKSNVCDAKGGTLVVTATICPPPEVNQFSYCDEFKKPLGDPYWKKKGNLQVTMEVFDRPDDLQWGNIWRDNKAKTAAVGEYKKDPDNLKDILNFNVPEQSVKPWYLYNKAEKVGCRECVVNYDVSGSKVNSALLFEAAASSGTFSKDKCPPKPGK